MWQTEVILLAVEPSKTQIDKLGERLKKGNINEDDLRLLDEYRLSFSDAYETVVGVIQNELGLEPTGRPAKSTTSISEKLRRESVRLTQIQDIAGCRLVVKDLAEQDRVVESLVKFFDNVTVVDRRKQPSYGYRAVHVIVRQRGKLIEIQVRTALQHIWAEQSEKLSDLVDPAIKYGGGNEEIHKLLMGSSDQIAAWEDLEANLLADQQALQILISDQEKVAANQKIMEDLQRQVIAAKTVIAIALQDTVNRVTTLIGENNDIPD